MQTRFIKIFTAAILSFGCGSSDGLLTENATCLADSDQVIVDERNFSSVIDIAIDGVGVDGQAQFGALLSATERTLWGVRLRLKQTNLAAGQIIVKVFQDDLRILRGAVDLREVGSEYDWHLVRFDTQVELDSNSSYFFTLTPEVASDRSIAWSSGAGEGLIEYDESSQEFVATESREAHYQALYCP